MKIKFLLIFLLVLTGSSLLGATRFINNNDGTIIDSITGLMWQKDDDGNWRNWEEALSYCNNLRLAGYDDWRLPNIQELLSIMDFGLYNSTFDHTFFNVQNFSFYWSSTTYISNPSYAWVILSSSGENSYQLKTSRCFTICVRGKSQNIPDTGQTKCFDNEKEIKCPQDGEDFYGQDGNYIESPREFLVKDLNGKKVVLDLVSKLMWVYSDFGVRTSWDDGLMDCENLNYASYNDWRTPTLFELTTIIDYGKHNPALDTSEFGYITLANWSSNLFAYRENYAWIVDFTSGKIYWKPRTYSYSSRCVRSVPDMPLNLFKKSLLSFTLEENKEQPKPEDNIIKAPLNEKFFLLPILEVEDDDVGKVATLLMYIQLSDGTALFLPEIRNIELKKKQVFPHINTEISLNDSFINQYVDIYFGYEINGKIKYNAARLIILSPQNRK